MHRPAHVFGFAPAAQAHWPDWQALPTPVTASQSWQVAPQAWEFVWAFTHPPAQYCGVAPPQVTPQIPPEQSSKDLQAIPQPPQW
jgi:hypothetical protein